MNKIDPIIAVSNVPASSRWYQSIFACQSIHGGNHFDVLVDAQGDVLLCLHQWGLDEHPSMIDKIQPGNGLILYLRTDQMMHILERATQSDDADPSPVALNTNTGKKEFSLTDPDGYCWIISEAHTYGG